MLHDDQRIAEIAQMLERVEQLVIVSLVQSDTRLVQNVGDSDETGTDLCRKTDTLRLTAGKRTGRTRQ